jgi:epoxyqueuosine reductase QueG
MDQSTENFDMDYRGDSQPSSPYKRLKPRPSQPHIEAAAAVASFAAVRASHSNSPAFKSAREHVVLRKNCNSCVLRKVSLLTGDAPSTAHKFAAVPSALA